MSHWTCSLNGTCWCWSWDGNGMPIKLKEPVFVNANGPINVRGHQELSGEPRSMNIHAFPSAPLLFLGGRFGGGIHRNTFAAPLGILVRPPCRWLRLTREGRGRGRLENWEWIIPGSPISPPTSPALPWSSLEAMPAISLSLSSSHGGDMRGSSRSCRPTTHTFLSFSAQYILPGNSQSHNR